MKKERVLLVLFILLFILSIDRVCFAQREVGIIAYSRLTEGFWQIWTLEVSTHETRQITFSSSDKRYPIWLEDGKKIMYRTNNAKMFIIDLDNNKEIQVFKEFGIITDPALSKITRRLAFTRYEGYLKDESEIWTIQLDGKDQRVLTKEQGLQYHPSWSPDGNTIVYTSGKNFGSHQIWCMDKEGRNNEKLTDNDGSYDILPVFSPDGKKIVFASNRDGNFDIWVMNKDGGELKNLSRNKSLDTRPSFSPDGRQIIFTSTRSGSLQLWTMDSDGTAQQQVTDGKSECQDATWIKMRKE